MNPVDPLFAAASRARERAHAPYSGFRVGAALRTASGQVYAGANVENASYPQGWCAETSAIAQMIVAGDTEITEVLVLAEGERLCTPCGGCRQKLAEFARPDTPVLVAGPDGVRAQFTLGELLPHGFGLDRVST